MGRILAGLALAALLPPATAGQDISNSLERFRLFNSCRPMKLVVEGLDADAADLGLTQEALQAAAESRLRAARLYTANNFAADFSYLYVNVNVISGAFSVLLSYRKWVTDEFGQSADAQTWHTGATGTHGRDAGYVLAALSQYLDRFLAAYLRVNEEACGYPAAQP